MKETEEKRWKDFLEYRERISAAPSDEVREKIRVSFMAAHPDDFGPDYDPDDDRVMMAHTVDRTDLN